MGRVNTGMKAEKGVECGVFGGKKKKSQRETTLEIGNLRMRSRLIDGSIANRIQEREERISGAEDAMENIQRYHDTTVNENAKCKMQKGPNPKHPGNPGDNEKTKTKGNMYR